MEKANIKLLGDGFICEGEYNDIKIIGDGKSEGNIVANKVKILGDCNFNGNLDFESLKVTGNFETKGVL